MSKYIYEKRTWEVDGKGTTVTTERLERGKSMSPREAIKMGILAMPKSKEARLKLFSESELEEMGYGDKEEDL